MRRALSVLLAAALVMSVPVQLVALITYWQWAMSLITIHQDAEAFIITLGVFLGMLVLIGVEIVMWAIAWEWAEKADRA